ncbi:RNA polymerase sigma factor [Rhodovulum sp. YNF3179]|uniref:RNA polymerase sigma factor n=1 Tax=Rhodovulum sp. YNF3179 TaxID=3425127 RepID=UPI003D34C2F4
MRMSPDPDADLSDDVLLLRYANGDGAAARVLTARHAPRVLGLAQRMLGDRAEAEDVTQEAMLRLWRRAPDWRQGEARLSTWLWRVTANLCTDRLRRRRGVALDSVPEPADAAPSADQRLMAADRVAALDRALAALPERQRLAVVLRHIEGASNPEIAETLDTSVEAVESLLARGRRALAAALGGEKEKLGLDR